MRKRGPKGDTLGNVISEAAEQAERIHHEAFGSVGGVGGAGKQAQPLAGEQIAAKKPAAMVTPFLVEDVDPARADPGAAVGKILVDAGVERLDIAYPLFRLPRIDRQQRCRPARPHADFAAHS